MATYTAVTPVAPTGAVNVRAYKASSFAPYSGKSSFPAVGQTAPANPDLTDAAATVGAANTLTLPTQEPYVVCWIDGSTKVVRSYLNQFHPTPALAGVIVVHGNGAPSSTVGTPVGPMIYLQDDGTSGNRLWVYTTATGWIAVAGF